MLSIGLVTIGCGRPITKNDNGRIIELSEDDVFTIKLKEPVQSEYEWSIVSKNNHIKLTEPIIRNDTDISTEFTFEFKTVGTGEDFLKLVYTNGPFIKDSFELRVIVGTIGRIEANER
ncbi:hypothetical protein Celal_2984 [Cellulophaga algicola DSM 14237]|uniref:Proteinase inhibitor I42 chagasin domain-containing protein n=1 Tax=Cellulophaga algicola (strain DSM 14237 / IC166 / ACAM 630) TaxID=688270 RepID=E6XEG9_CELAD|nr:hypothetical protein Celal_2984 [Cellulophaga algicola DSM 14237]